MKEEMVLSGKNHLVFARYSKEKSPLCVVFVHGIGSNLTQWDTYQKHLSGRGVGSISLDLPGSGKSQKPDSDKNYMISSLAEDVSSVVKNITQKPVVLVGHSMGAMICLEIAHRNLLAMKGLVLVEPVYRTPFEQLMLGKRVERLAGALAEFAGKHIKAHRCIEPDMNKAGGDRIKLAVWSMLTMPLSVQLECISKMSTTGRTLFQE